MSNKKGMTVARITEFQMQKLVKWLKIQLELTLRRAINFELVPYVWFHSVYVCGGAMSCACVMFATYYWVLSVDIYQSSFMGVVGQLLRVFQGRLVLMDEENCM